jgi:hypothetical protein
MITPQDVYLSYRKAESHYKNRPYRTPNDMEYFWATKKTLTPKVKAVYEEAAGYFNTKWHNINMDKYFAAGFEFFGNKFSPAMFFKDSLMNLYIAKDKNEKRELRISNERILETAKFLKKYIEELPDVYKQLRLSSKLKIYGAVRDQQQSMAVKHYLGGKIDKYTFVWLIKSGYVSLSDDDKELVPYIVENFREYLSIIEKHTKTFDAIREVIEIEKNKA